MRKIYLILFFIIFVIYLISGNGETPYNYFSLLAYSLSQGRLYVTQSTSALSELIPTAQNRFYVPYAPMPALILAPLATVLRSVPPQSLISQMFGGLFAVITAANGYVVTKSLKKAVYLSLLISLGTNVWYTAAVGSSWYFAQIVAATFLSAAIFNILSHPKNDIVTGLLLGAAYLSRPHVILALPFFIFYKNFEYKKALKIILGLSPALMFNAWYNFERFGVIWDKGYSLIPNVLNEPWYQQGIFSISYIPRHLEVIFLGLPKIIDKFPFVVPSIIGMAIWVTFPAVFLLLRTNLREKTNKLALLALILILIPILMHGAVGFTQFGYRFAIDIYPFLFLIFAQILKNTKLNKKLYLLLFLSVLINFWGVLLINKFGIYV